MIRGIEFDHVMAALNSNVGTYLGPSSSLWRVWFQDQCSCVWLPDQLQVQTGFVMISSKCKMAPCRMPYQTIYPDVKCLLGHSVLMEVITPQSRMFPTRIFFLPPQMAFSYLIGQLDS